jgi:hypothetical protein
MLSYKTEYDIGSRLEGVDGCRSGRIRGYNVLKQIVYSDGGGRYSVDEIFAGNKILKSD